MSGALYVGASGFSYPSWKGGFYPADAKPDTFLSHYAGRVNAVELNNTFYRVPEEDQFDRWAAQVPDGFRFAVTMSRRLTSFGRVEGVDAFCRMALRLGERLGPLRVRCNSARRRVPPAFLDRSSASRSMDFRHDSWDVPEVTAVLDERGVARVDALETAAPFRYLRFRDPPYDEAALAMLQRKIRPLVAAGLDVYGFFRHEDEPTAPLYAERLRDGR